MVNKAHHCAEESVRQYFDTDASLIQTDLQEIASWEEQLRSAAHAPDKSRLLMILAASSQSRSKLNVVLPRLLMQATEAQMSADMIVGLDRGTVHHMVTAIPGLVSCACRSASWAVDARSWRARRSRRSATVSMVAPPGCPCRRSAPASHPPERG